MPGIRLCTLYSMRALMYTLLQAGGLYSIQPFLIHKDIDFTVLDKKNKITKEIKLKLC